jgi:D-alanyl-D-alanine carboxypeptidase
MRPADRFRIASLTKTYVAAVTLQLAAERRLGLDDPVARYLPGLLRLARPSASS